VEFLDSSQIKTQQSQEAQETQENRFHVVDGGSLSFNAHSKKADRKMPPTGMPIRTKITIGMVSP
jgi:hypothetical protein